MESVGSGALLAEWDETAAWEAEERRLKDRLAKTPGGDALLLPERDGMAYWEAELRLREVLPEREGRTKAMATLLPLLVGGTVGGMREERANVMMALAPEDLGQQ